MNSDRLTQMSSSTIITGLNNKWTNAYKFLGFTFSSIDTDNGITFDSLNKNQFALDLAYYLEPEDIYFLMFQVKDKLIQVTNGTNTIVFTSNNLIQILIHKWNKGITQLNSDISSILINEDYLVFNFQFKSAIISSSNSIETEVFIIRTILKNYVERYFIEEYNNAVYPNLSVKLKLNWDTVKARFFYRMDFSSNNDLFIDKESVVLNLNNRHVILPYIDGNLTHNVTYSSSDITVASVDSGGLVTPLKEGTTNIVVLDTVSGKSKICVVTVTSHNFIVNQSLVYLHPGAIKNIKSYLDGVKTTNVTYAVSNPNIINIDDSGTISPGVDFGTCTVKVTDNVYGLTCNVLVRNVRNYFTLSKLESTVAMGETFQIKSYFNDKLTKDVTYSSSDNTAASVDVNGLVTTVTLLKSCIITATHILSGLSSSIKINVVKPSLFISGGNLSTILGANKLTTKTLTISGTLTSADVICIRDMAINGVLEYLDMENITIVNDAAVYYNGKSLLDNSIGQEMLKGCTKLKNLILPRSVTDISVDAITSCTNLLYVRIFENVKTIGNNAFKGNPNLSQVIIDDGSNSLTVYDSAFDNCTLLPSLNFPSRLVSLSSGILDWSDNCKTLTFNSVVPPTFAGSFGGSVQTIYVPSALVNAYKTASGWGNYTSKIYANPN